MIVTCQECDTSFNFPEKHIKESGTKVRCSKCRQIFTVFPAAGVSAVASETEKSPPTGGQSANKEPAAPEEADAVGGLDDIDLNEIENMLDLDAGEQETAEPEPEPDLEADDFKLNFDLEENSSKAASEFDIEFDETQELDLSDLDSKPEGQPDLDDTEEIDLDLGLDAGAPDDKQPAAAVDSEDDLNFDLDLGLDDTETPAAEDKPAGQAAADDLGLDIDLDFDDGAKSDAAGSELELSETQEFDLDNADNLLDLDDVEAVDDGDDAIDDLAELDLGSDDEVSDQAAADDLDDLDGLDLDLDLDETPTDAAPAASGPADDDDLDFDLDLDQAAGATATPATAGELSSDDDLDDLDFELDIEADDEAIEDIGSLEADETAELDLTDLEEIIDDGADAADMADKPPSDVDFELDLDFNGSQGGNASDEVVGMDETEDFDLSGLDEALEADSTPEMIDDIDQEDADNLDDLDLDMNIEEELLDDDGSGGDDFEITDLDDMLVDDESDEDLGDGSQSDDFELELDLSEVEDASGGPESSAGDDVGMDDMLEMDDEELASEASDIPADDDMEMAFDDAAPAQADDEDAADIELDFELDESDAQTAAMAAEDESGGPAQKDTFDMGTMTDSGDTDVGPEDEPDFAMQDDDFDIDDDAPQKKGGLLRALLLLVLLIGGGYGAMIVAQAAGFGIPYVPNLPGSDMPFLTNLVGGEKDELGNLKILIQEDVLNGEFVENSQLGPLFVIKGKVKNNYSSPRRFIQMTGKIYSKGRKQSLTQKAYAGNVLSAAELERLDQKAIVKQMKNRFGKKRSNANVKKGGSIPFMIVFSNLPPDLDEYTVEVAGSKPARN